MGGGQCGLGLFSLDGAFKHMNDSFQWGPVGPWGWGSDGVKHQGSGRDRTGGSFRLKHKANRRKKKEVTHSPVVCGGWGSRHHRCACATQRARFSGGTSEAHLAASSNKAWQGLAGVGRQLREEGDEHRHSFKAALWLFIQWVIDAWHAKKD